jgi:tRNA A37 threonylcarbamoyltransferase TsaD
MPGAALEHWSQINEVDDSILEHDINRWVLPRPLTAYKKNVLAFSFTGIRTAVESIIEKSPEMTEEDKKSFARAAQILVFRHVAEKCVLGIKTSGDNSRKGTFVVSGGVACNMALRKTYFIFIPRNNGSLRQTLDQSGLRDCNIIFPPVEYCTV